MGICKDQKRKTIKYVAVFAGTSIPTALLTAKSGPQMYMQAAETGVIVGLIATAGYYFYECDFSIIKCVGGGAVGGISSIACGIASEVGLTK